MLNLVELVGYDDPEAQCQDDGGVEKEEDLAPSLARIRGEPQALALSRSLRLALLLGPCTNIAYQRSKPKKPERGEEEERQLHRSSNRQETRGERSAGRS